MWEVRVQHAGLRAYRVVRGVTQREAELKASLQVAAWNERWANRLLALKAKQEKLQVSWDLETNKKAARGRTAELEWQLNRLGTLLITGIEQEPFRWSSLTNTATFAQPRPNPPIAPIKPVKPDYSAEPKKPSLSSEPDPDAYIFRWSMSGVRRVFSGQTTVFFAVGSTIRQLIGRLLTVFGLKETNWAKRPLEEAKAEWRAKADQTGRNFEEASMKWRAECAAVDASYEKLLDAHEKAHQEALRNHAAAVHAWEFAKAEHDEERTARSAQIKALREEYKAGEASAVEYFFAEVLNHSKYPKVFPKGALSASIRAAEC